MYWVLLPIFLLWTTRSASFYFWIVLQPLLAMSWFIGLINMGFHAFIENDENGKRIACVSSLAFLNGSDDFFGEDDHMAHHNQGHIYWRDLPAHQSTQVDVWARYHASVFQGYDIFSFTLAVLFKAWPLLAERFVDTSGSLSKAEIAKLLEARARRREVPHTELLPPVPASRAKSHPEIAPRSPEGGIFHQALLGRLAEMQMGVARLMDLGFPPVVPIEDLQISKKNN